MIAILFYLLIATIICGAAYYIVGLVPLPAPFGRICQIIIIVVYIIIVLYLLFAMVPMLPSFPRRM